MAQMRAPPRRKANGHGSSTSKENASAARRASRGNATGRIQSGSSRVLLPVRSCWRRGSLRTVPGAMEHAQNAVSHSSLDRRTQRAAHNGPQAFVPFVVEKEDQEPLQ